MKPKAQSLTVRASLALVIVAALIPILKQAGIEVDPELKQAIILCIGAAMTYGLRRAAGGLK